MWSKLFLCMLIGFAAASDYAWKSDTEYKYQVRGRTLASLHQVDNQYAGISMKAEFTIQQRHDGVLQGRFQNAQYAQVHAKLPGGWHSHIPDAQLSYRAMPLSSKPFEIHMKNGTVQELIVDNSIPNWEANIIKSLVSQIQIDVQGENMIKSRYNQPAERDSVDISAEYKTMEDSVTGKCETLYDISQLPEHVLQTEPELAPLPHLKGDGEVIDIVKTRNYSNCDERVVYHFGLGDMEDWEPASSSMSDFFIRSSVSRVVLTGTLKRHTIQSSVTTNKIVMKPTPGAKQQGLVVSQLNITLAGVKPASSQPKELSAPKQIGNLVYTYNSPYASSNQVREGTKNSAEHQYDSDSSSSSSSSSEEHRQFGDNNESRRQRHRRSAEQQKQFRGRFDDSSSSSSSSSSEEDNNQWQQDKPTLNQAPHTPLLPYTIGYMGQSIKNAQNINIVQAVQKIAKEIGKELQTPSEMPKRDTLAKFTILSNLIRNMNFHELEEASRELYNLKNKQEREHTDSWRAYRDAVAQAGTGPALLIVKEWISNMKIRGHEAAAIIATVANSARTPTDEYMRTFYTLATEQKVQNEAYLNDTAILSFAELVRKVYVRKDVSHNQYPVHAFGKFYKQNEQAVYNEYIPYLAKQLKNAIHHADSHKIQVYIRALGNVGHRQILEVFEPYLEGQKQISQFQRLLMVVSMDKLILESPKTTRSVLYKIYQNEGELPEIRVAAVHQLMRTSPPASMLQRMAEATHTDSSNQVSAAVKSAIETAAQLEHPAHVELATSAQGALPLVNSEPFGFQYSKQYLSDYVVREMNLVYKQHVGILGSEDSSYPQGIMYHLHGNMEGYKRQYMNVAAMVSNVQDLVQVVKDQTEQDQAEKEQDAKQHSEWSSDKIASLLKMHYQEREQLEGNLDFRMAGVQRFYTFNNQTIESLPQFLQYFAGQLKQGKEFNVTKFYNPFEMTLSFPTAMGLPFVYTLETPTLVSVHGEVQAISHPEFVKSGEIQTPETVNVTADIRLTMATKKQAKLGFVTPFDHQHYVAGYDKHFQLNLPVRAQVDIDIENQQVRAEIQPLDEQDEEIIRYSTVPYTAKHDILDLKPVSRISASQVVHIREPETNEYVLGKKTGLVFRVKCSTEHKFSDFKWLYERYQRHEGLSALIAPLSEDSLIYTDVSIRYEDKQSDVDSVIFQMGWNQTYFSGKREGQAPEFNQLYQKVSDLSDSEDRQQYFLKKAAAGINNADASVYDFSVQFQGKQFHAYNATLAIGKSTVDKVSRILFYYNKEASNDKDYEACVQVENKIPNTNGLDFVYALKFDPTSTSHVKAAYGEKCQNGAKFDIKAKLEQSEERQRYLQGRPLAKLCHQQMKEGNQQLWACRNMTARANLLDQYSFDIKFDNMGQQARNLSHKMYHAIQYIGYPYLDQNDLEGHGKQNQIRCNVNFNIDFQSVNVSLQSEHMQSEFNNIRLNQWVKAAVAIHPVFDLQSRLYGQMENEVYNPTCVLDQNMVETFDNRTYPLPENQGQEWYVMMQYRVQPAANNQEQQHNNKERFQSENDYDYVVLARQAQNNQRDIKIVINDQMNFYEIDLFPAGGSSHSGSQPAGKVFVNGKQVQFDDQHSYDIENGLIKIFALPNGEVKVEMNGDFYVLYDGERLKLTTTESDQFRGDVRGLCGTMDGEENTDFLTPKNCILRDAQEFVATYAVNKDASSPARERLSQGKKSECLFREQIYANVISPRDYRRQDQQKQQRQYGHQQQQQGHGSCTKHQTQYVQEDSDNTICFTIRPLPVCRSSCKADKKIVKNVDVHCVQKNNVSDLWKKQIEKGASPDFSLKSVTKSIKIKVPQSCSP